MVSLSQFYTAGTFWAAVAGVVGTVVLGVAGTWIAARQVPKRRLLYGMASPVALLTSAANLPPGIEIRRRGGGKLDDPQIVTVAIQSNGRQSISPEMFSKAQPLVLKLGVPLVEVLKVTSQPEEQAIPDFEEFESGLKVGPSGMAAKQRVEFSLLVDGEPHLTAVGHLPDVTVQRQQADPNTKIRRALLAGSAATIVAASVILSIVLSTAPPVSASNLHSWAQGPPMRPSLLASKELAYLHKHLGAPYVWGGAGPDEFDCSGLVMAALVYAGVKSPHSSYLQMSYFGHIPLTDLEPGDILGFAGNANVGVYIGEGKLIDSPSAGSHVEIIRLRGWYAAMLDGAVRP